MRKGLAKDHRNASKFPHLFFSSELGLILFPLQMGMCQQSRMATTKAGWWQGSQGLKGGRGTLTSLSRLFETLPHKMRVKKESFSFEARSVVLLNESFR